MQLALNWIIFSAPGEGGGSTGCAAPDSNAPEATLGVPGHPSRAPLSESHLASLCLTPQSSHSPRSVKRTNFGPLGGTQASPWDSQSCHVPIWVPFIWERNWVSGKALQTPEGEPWPVPSWVWGASARTSAHLCPGEQPGQGSEEHLVTVATEKRLARSDKRTEVSTHACFQGTGGGGGGCFVLRKVHL